MKKTLKQFCLNKVIDSCIDVLGSTNASNKQKRIALKLLNRSYEKSGVNLKIDDFGGIKYVR